MSGHGEVPIGGKRKARRAQRYDFRYVAKKTRNELPNGKLLGPISEENFQLIQDRLKV